MQVKVSVLVLNASYEAINVCNLRRAMKMVFKGTAQTEEVSDIQNSFTECSNESATCNSFGELRSCPT